MQLKLESMKIYVYIYPRHSSCFLCFITNCWGGGDVFMGCIQWRRLAKCEFDWTTLQQSHFNFTNFQFQFQFEFKWQTRADEWPYNTNDIIGVASSLPLNAAATTCTTNMHAHSSTINSNKNYKRPQRKRKRRCQRSSWPCTYTERKTKQGTPITISSSWQAWAAEFRKEFPSFQVNI